MQQISYFQFQRMVLLILALRMRTFFAFLCDDVILFINFSSQNKFDLDIEYNEIGLMSSMPFDFSQSPIENFFVLNPEF